MADDEYLRTGTLTTFTGIPVDESNPYSYGEAKRVMRLMAERLRKRADLKSLGMDPSVSGRKAIAGRSGEQVWDYLTLKGADAEKSFTSFPHLTMPIHRRHYGAMVTLPNGMPIAMRKRLTEDGSEAFADLMRRCLQELRRNLPVRKGLAIPHFYLQQRHFLSQRSKGTEDATIDIDLRVLVEGGQDGVKYQPQWGEAACALIADKKANMQLGGWA